MGFLCNRLRAALDCDKKFKGNETSLTTKAIQLIRSELVK